MGLYAASQGVPHFGFDVALNVSADYPNDVGSIFVTFTQELAVGLGFFHTHQSRFYQPAPDAYHADVDAVAFGGLYDMVHVVPVSVDAFLVDVLEVESVGVRHLPVGIECRYAVYGLHLHDIEAGFAASSQVVPDFVAVEAFGHEPAGLTLPKERFTVFVFQITALFRHEQFPVFPGNISRRFGGKTHQRACRGKKCQEDFFHICLF